jgi:hypothetical protein
MQTIIAAIPASLVQLIEALRQRLGEAHFVARHRRRATDFTRNRTLTFPVVFLLLLQKTTKSVQRHLHEFLAQWFAQPGAPAVTPGAWTQARAKFQHTAFIELNQEVLLPLAYAPEHEQAERRRTWRGHRLLGVDGSSLRLPPTAELLRTFGEKTVTNQGGATGTRYPEARMSVLYDLLNDLGLDARLEPGTVGEVDLALQQTARLQPDDLLLWDRGFTGFVLMAAVGARGAHFLGRCSRASFRPAQDLFRLNRAGRSVVTQLFAPEDQRAELKRRGLPTTLVARFVSVRLPTGELEVLVTSLLDEAVYPTHDFLALYHQRWGQETYYGRLKGRLDLEHWSGETAEAVRQDFFAAVFLANLESLVSQPAQDHLAAISATRQHPAQVNRADSYHALKERVVDLLAGNEPAEDVIRQLQGWFAANPVSVRPERQVPRRLPSPARSYQFQRHVRKTVY